MARNHHTEEYSIKLSKAMILFRKLTNGDIDKVKWYDEVGIFTLEVGAIQSGKTVFMQCLMAAKLLMGRSCALLIKGEKAHHAQFVERLDGSNFKWNIDGKVVEKSFKGFNDVYIDHMKQFGYTVPGFNHMYIDEKSKFNKEKCQTFIRRDTKEVGIIIMLCLQNQVGMFNDSVCELKYNDIPYSYDVVSDEADELCYWSTSSKIYEEMKILRDNCTSIDAVTATPHEQLLHERELEVSKIVVLSTSEEYRGVQNLQFKILKYKIKPPTMGICTKKCKKNGNKCRCKDMLTTELIGEADQNLPEVFSDLSHSDYFTTTTGSTNPMICLYKGSDLTNVQKKTSKYLHKIFPKKFTTIIFNGEGCTIQSEQLKGITIKISGKKYSQDFNMTGIHILNGLTIQTVLQYLKISGGVESHPRIVIIAGKLANRGITFKDLEHEWHLTHQYLGTPAKSMDRQRDVQANIQALRILGRVNDKISLTVYTTPTIHRSIVNGHYFQKEMIGRMKDLMHDFPEIIDNDIVMELVPDFVINREKLVDTKFSKRKYILSKCDDDDGGIPMDVFRNLHLKNVEQWTPKYYDDTNNDIYNYITHIIKKNITQSQHELFESIILTLQDQRGKWVAKSSIVKIQGQQNITWHWHKHQSAVNEDVKGLLMKKIKNKWYFRYN